MEKHNKNTKEMEIKLLLCIQYKSPISRWVMPEGRGQGPIHSTYGGDDDDDVMIIFFRTNIVNSNNELLSGIWLWTIVFKGP